MSTHVLIACSKSKSIPTASELVWQSNEAMETWNKLWHQAKPRLSAADLYTGVEFQKQLSVCQQLLDGQVFVISAGAGLIEVKPSKKVPSYEATFIGGKGPTYSTWPLLPEGGLENLSIQEGDQVVSFAPPQYHRALAEDPLFTEIASQLVVASTSPLATQAGTVIKVHPRCKEKTVFGVKGIASKSLNTKFLQTYLEHGVKGMQRIYNQATKLPNPPSRRKVDDAELMEYIIAAPADVQKSITRMVAHIRHTCNIAAVDTRIRRILLNIKNNNL